MSGIRDSHPALSAILAVVLLLGVLIAGQVLAAGSAPPGGIASTGRLLGRTSYAYLGGLRTFTAAVLWLRLEPTFHGYYSDRPVEELVEFLPTMRLVQALDPQFEQSYYVSSFILARRGKMAGALALSREGIKNNPSSGLMLANYTQILLMQDKKANLPEMLKLAEQGLRRGVRWSSADEQYEGYGVFETVYRIAGDTRMASKVRGVKLRIGEQPAGLGDESGGFSPGTRNQPNAQP